MEVKLVVASGKNAGQVIPLTGRRFFIGRGDDCHLRPYSDLVSRHHCAILLEQGEAVIRDFGSKNGTLVNGQRVRGEQTLHGGDRLRVGDLEFEVQLTVEGGGEKRPKVRSVHEAAARTAEAAARARVDVDDELDLASLLSENTSTVAANPQTQTVEIRRPKDPATIPPTPPPAAAAKAAKPAKPTTEPVGKPDRPSGPGAARKATSPDASSSRDAAAAMLKNFFRGH